MLRLRDEARMTLHAYMTLYQSGTALGFKKSTKIEQGKGLMTEKIEFLERENRILRQEVSGSGDHGLMTFPLQIANIKGEIQMTEKNYQDRRNSDIKQRNEELNFYRRTNQQLKSQIESIQSLAK